MHKMMKGIGSSTYRGSDTTTITFRIAALRVVDSGNRKYAQTATEEVIDRGGKPGVLVGRDRNAKASRVRTLTVRSIWSWAVG